MTRGLVHALAASLRDGAPLLHLLDCPCVTQGGTWHPIPENTARLLAFLALNGGPHDRRYVAMRLWPDADDARAAGSLRSALWRVNTLGIKLVDTTKQTVALREGVGIDVRLLGDWAARMIEGTPRPADLHFESWDLVEFELLSGWYDDWVVLERERLRQRVLHALELFGAQLIAAGRSAEAVDVALVAVHADPLRESAERVLIAAHLAEGNWGEAQRRFAHHRDLVRSELGVEPSPVFKALLVPSPAERPSL